MEHTIEQRVNVKFCVKLQKSPTDRTPVHVVDIEEFSHSKEVQETPANFLLFPQLAHVLKAERFTDVESIKSCEEKK
jgi:hypothetical protein